MSGYNPDKHLGNAVNRLFGFSLRFINKSQANIGALETGLELCSTFDEWS